MNFLISNIDFNLINSGIILGTITCLSGAIYLIYTKPESTNTLNESTSSERIAQESMEETDKWLEEHSIWLKGINYNTESTGEYNFWKDISSKRHTGTIKRSDTHTRIKYDDSTESIVSSGSDSTITNGTVSTITPEITYIQPLTKYFPSPIESIIKLKDLLTKSITHTSTITPSNPISTNNLTINTESTFNLTNLFKSPINIKGRFTGIFNSPTTSPLNKVESQIEEIQSIIEQSTSAGSTSYTPAGSPSYTDSSPILSNSVLNSSSSTAVTAGPSAPSTSTSTVKDLSLDSLNLSRDAHNWRTTLGIDKDTYLGDSTRLRLSDELVTLHKDEILPFVAKFNLEHEDSIIKYYDDNYDLSSVDGLPSSVKLVRDSLISKLDLDASASASTSAQPVPTLALKQSIGIQCKLESSIQQVIGEQSSEELETLMKSTGLLNTSNAPLPIAIKGNSYPLATRESEDWIISWVEQFINNVNL